MGDNIIIVSVAQSIAALNFSITITPSELNTTGVPNAITPVSYMPFEIIVAPTTPTISIETIRAAKGTLRGTAKRNGQRLQQGHSTDSRPEEAAIMNLP